MTGTATARSSLPATLWRFFALTYAISWSLWGLALLHAIRGTSAPAVQVLSYAGVFGPCLAALVCTGIDGRAAVGRLLRGMQAVRQKRIWYMAALFPVPVCMALANALTSRPILDPGISPILIQPAPLLMIFASTLLAAGIGEETGWRGYALPILLRRFRPLAGSVLLGLVWAVWHAPLFWMPGTVQHQILSPSGGLLFLAFCVCWSILFTWLYLGTRGSLLMAVLFHAVSDFASIFLQPLASEMALGLLVAMMATIALALRGIGRKMEA